jgi:putative SOS response-associated peptidase YedK
MCNEQRRRIALDQIRNDWSQTRIPLRFPEGLPNLAPLDSIRITDPNAIIRAQPPGRSEAGATAPPEQRPESAQAGRPAPVATGSTGSGRPDPAAARSAAAPASSEAGANAPPEQRTESLQAGRPAPEATGPTGSGRPDPAAAPPAAAPASSEAGANASPEQRAESLPAGRPAPKATGPTGSGRPDTAAAPPLTDPTASPFAAELIVRRWSWPGPGGKPVYNFRSDGREFGNSARGGRCLIVADGFYEFTTPEVAPGAPKPKRKHKWLFTKPGEEWFCIAGLWRATPEVGEAYTMLTCPPGPDVAPYHGRQVVVLDRADWAAWLDVSNPAARFCRPLPAGTLAVEQVQ